MQLGILHSFEFFDKEHISLFLSLVNFCFPLRVDKLREDNRIWVFLANSKL